MNKTGFGFLRLPLSNNEICYDLLDKMVDAYLDLGGTYFDTAYTYLDGQSEIALRKSLVERYPRYMYKIADKLPGWKVRSYDECQKYFDEQLEKCGVDYFDVYLIHWLNEKNYEICETYDEFRFLRKVKEEGKAKAIGFSYHDSPELLEQILLKHPEVDYVQLQINYLDWESTSIQSRQCYDVAKKYNKKVIIMEPVKGGSLVNMSNQAKDLLLQYDSNKSIASWAIRFASGLDLVEIVLSGMNTLEQMYDNMQNFEPLNEEELKLLEKVANVIRSQTAIACTACRYCVSHCPKKIAIPDYFAIYNDYARNPAEDWKMQFAYDALIKEHGKASDCVNCKQCERNCPQKLPITDWLKKVSQAYE